MLRAPPPIFESNSSSSRIGLCSVSCRWIFLEKNIRQVVQTCVLSTRWRHLWLSVPCLDIDQDEFNRIFLSSDEDNSSSDSDTSDSDSDRDRLIAFNKRLEKYKNWEPFEDFALTLMRRCNIAQLDSFRLHIVGSRAPEFADRMAAGWLCRAMKYCTPDRASKLGLSSGSWRLKRLHLCHVHLDDQFLKCVSSVCRSLEDLELNGCSCEIQSIASDSLKTLVLRNCGWRRLSEIISPTLKTLVIQGGSNTDACMLVVMAPALAYLHLAVDVYKFRGGVSLNEVPSVARALIHLLCHKYCSRSKLAGDQFKLLCSISNSINLELSGVGKTVIGREPSFQEFKNLRNLLLDNCDLSDDFKTLVFFLRSSPVLEKLTLRCCEFPKYPSKEKGMHILTPRMPILNKTSSSKMLLQFPKYPSKEKGMPILTTRMPILNKTSSSKMLLQLPKYSSKKKGMPILTTRMPILATRPKEFGTPILKKISSSELHGLDLLCENLKVEIIYKDGYGPHFIRLLQLVSVNLLEDNIKLTKVK